MHTWYYMSAAHQEGPFDEPTFVRMCKAGDIKPSTEIYSETRTKTWILASTLPVVMQAIEAGNVHRQAKANEAAKKKKDQLEALLPVTPKQAPQPQQQMLQPQPLQQPPQVVQQTIYVQQRQSNAIPILVNCFLWPGLGQLIQGRAIVGLIFMVLWVLSVLSIFILIGFILAPAVWFIALVDVY